MHFTDNGEQISGELQGKVGLFIKYSAILTIELCEDMQCLQF